MGSAAIIRELQARHDMLPYADLCLRAVQFLIDRPPQETQLLTFQTFAKALAKPRVDDEVVAVVSLLSGAAIDAIDIRYLLFSDDEEPVELTNEELADIRQHGVLIHPITGNPVEEYEQHLVPFFVPSEKFLAADR